MGSEEIEETIEAVAEQEMIDHHLMKTGHLEEEEEEISEREVSEAVVAIEVDLEANVAVLEEKEEVTEVVIEAEVGTEVEVPQEDAEVKDATEG